ncbi:MAG: hypothetical protein SWH68_06220 [Thermodesulfobacteriota bacterium]|nr:hypothetical protein [Thermodesulfobacteriota bacterium]
MSELTASRKAFNPAAAFLQQVTCARLGFLALFVLNDLFFFHTFLCSPKEKYAKERVPRSWAFGFPRRVGFFGAGSNSPVLLWGCGKHRLLRQSARVFRKNRPCSAALQGAGHVLLFSCFGRLKNLTIN